jgi:hypothetical protein
VGIQRLSSLQEANQVEQDCGGSHAPHTTQQRDEKPRVTGNREWSAGSSKCCTP